MQATVQTVNDEPKVTRTGKTYYQIQADGDRFNVFRKFNIGDVIEYEEGNLPGWPRNVRLAATATENPVKDVVKLGKFIELTTLKTLLGNIFELANGIGIKDDQAIVALNNTILIALNRQGYQFDLTSLLKAPF